MVGSAGKNYPIRFDVEVDKVSCSCLLAICEGSFEVWSPVHCLAAFRIRTYKLKENLEVLEVLFYAVRSDEKVVDVRENEGKINDCIIKETLESFCRISKSERHG